MAVATVDDLLDSLRRPLRGDEQQYIPALLHRAEILIRVRIPGLDAALADPVYYDLVRQVEAEAVARVLRADNAGIYRSESEDGYAYQLNFQVASGLLDILPAEWQSLGAAGYRMVAPETDGYAAAKYGRGRPDLFFQREFGPGDDLSTVYLRPID